MVETTWQVEFYVAYEPKSSPLSRTKTPEGEKKSTEAISCLVGPRSSSKQSISFGFGDTQFAERSNVNENVPALMSKEEAYVKLKEQIT